jgi:hypothetical protein
VWFAEHDAPSGAPRAKQAQAFAHEPRTDPAPLVLRENRNGPEPEPTKCAVRDRYRRYRDMADYAGVDLCDERARPRSLRGAAVPYDSLAEPAHVIESAAGFRRRAHRP